MRNALGVDVSRETEDRLRDLAAEVDRWTQRINLIATASPDEIWQRHIRDSAQLWPIADLTTGIWADLGSGGGFPGLVIALIAAEAAPDLAVHLVESDRRKVAFLQHIVARHGLVRVTLHGARIESLPSMGADVVSARALAPLPKLLDLAVPHIAEGGSALFPKGERAAAEIEQARRSWRFELTEFPSRTTENATVLRLERIARV